LAADLHMAECAAFSQHARLAIQASAERCRARFGRTHVGPRRSDGASW
jgi:hypothetical protein